jgi:hypothetical protein
MLIRAKSNRGSAPVRPTEGTGQTGQDLGSRDEQQPAGQLLQIQILISFYEFKQDFGDSRSTSWVFHSHDLVHQNLLNCNTLILLKIWLY